MSQPQLAPIIADLRFVNFEHGYEVRSRFSCSIFDLPVIKLGHLRFFALKTWKMVCVPNWPGTAQTVYAMITIGIKLPDLMGLLRH